MVESGRLLICCTAGNSVPRVRIPPSPFSKLNTPITLQIKNHALMGVVFEYGEQGRFTNDASCYPREAGATGRVESPSELSPLLPAPLPLVQ